ncbi:MAG: hypothetical protein HOV97_05065 [Nonomuraea sp.]|nr:hypothetical protein [Nonomuraea sp.]
MRQPRLVWSSTIGMLIVLDLWCHRNETVGDTLSECTRATFRTHTPAGRMTFLAAWGALTWWFVPHINRKAHEIVEGSS